MGMTVQATMGMTVQATMAMTVQATMTMTVQPGMMVPVALVVGTLSALSARKVSAHDLILTGM